VRSDFGTVVPAFQVDSHIKRVSEIGLRPVCQ